jgi:hypothetical protein
LVVLDTAPLPLSWTPFICQVFKLNFFVKEQGIINGGTKCFMALKVISEQNCSNVPKLNSQAPPLFQKLKLQAPPYVSKTQNNINRALPMESQND